MTKVKTKNSRVRKKPVKAGGASVSLFGQVWPAERDILWRPERFKYVRKIIKQQGCVFCEAREKGIGPESLVLARGKYSMAVLNKFPYNTGHLLVLPARHCGDLNELSEAEFAEMNQLLRFSIHQLKHAYDCHGLNVGLNLGAAGGAGIPEHIHYHVIPRWAGDSNFFPLIAETKVLIETLEQTFERLRPPFERFRAKEMA